MPAVTFYGPELHRQEGLDIGAIDIDSDRQWSFIARLRGDAASNSAIIKEVQPAELEATIEPLKSRQGDFRVTVRVKAGAKPVNFQADKQGYVIVASETDTAISNWIPLHGALIDLDTSH